MIVADTSVWVQFFRGKDRKTAEHLRELLERDEVVLVAPVRLEILAGASRHDFLRLQPLLSALPLLFPTEDTWREMERWVGVAIAAGKRFGMGDLLVGAIASGHAHRIWSLDADFERLATLGLVKIYHPI